MPTFALLPAAGISSRMGRSKLALPLGDRTVLERVLDTLRSAKITHVLLVLGPQSAALKPVAEIAGARVLLLEHPTQEMRATIQCGLDWLAEVEHPAAEDAFLLLPPDHPTLAPEVIEVLVKAYSENTATICVPTYNGRRGHPALISWTHIAGIRVLPSGQGLNTYLRAHAHETLEVPCTSPEILCDLDTPEDYERLRSFFEVH